MPKKGIGLLGGGDFGITFENDGLRVQGSSPGKARKQRLPIRTEPLASLNMDRLKLSFAWLGAILVWPAPAYWLSHTWMDQPDESIFLFAALPSLILVPLSLIEFVSENFVFLCSALAITGWILPLILFLRRCETLRSISIPGNHFRRSLVNPYSEWQSSQAKFNKQRTNRQANASTYGKYRPLQRAEHTGLRWFNESTARDYEALLRENWIGCQAMPRSVNHEPSNSRANRWRWNATLEPLDDQVGTRLDGVSTRLVGDRYQ